jgi:uncharacterized membrane protein
LNILKFKQFLNLNTFEILTFFKIKICSKILKYLNIFFEFEKGNKTGIGKKKRKHKTKRKKERRPENGPDPSPRAGVCSF